MTDPTNPTPWTPALDAFEANLDRVEAALATEAAWEELDLTMSLPAFEGEPSAAERERLRALQERAGVTFARLRDAMDVVRDEQLTTDTKIAAARVYGRTPGARS